MSVRDQLTEHEFAALVGLRPLADPKLHLDAQWVGTGVFLSVSGILNTTTVVAVEDVLAAYRLQGVARIYLDLMAVTTVDEVALSLIDLWIEAEATMICVVRTSACIEELRALLEVS